MVVTVTLNPAIDYHISVDNFNEGKSLSSIEDSYFAGGKGINVSRVLANMNRQTKAMAMIGGFTGDFIISEAKDFIHPIMIQDKNRINTKIKSKNYETEIHGVSPKISHSELQNLCDELSNLGEIDVLILSGSVPSSLNSDTYKKIASTCSPMTKIVIDTRGDVLKKSLELDSIFLLKPNKDEIGEFYSCEIKDTNHALDLAQKLKQNHNIEHLILSLGSEGAYFLYKDEIYFAEALKGTLISSVGSGDSVVAGFVHKFLESQNGLEAFGFAIACGAGTAFSNGLCTLQTAETLYKKVSIIKIQ